jgi:hypothetical protein
MVVRYRNWFKVHCGEETIVSCTRQRPSSQLPSSISLVFNGLPRDDMAFGRKRAKGTSGAKLPPPSLQNPNVEPRIYHALYEGGERDPATPAVAFLRFHAPIIMIYPRSPWKTSSSHGWLDKSALNVNVRPWVPKMMKQPCRRNGWL